MAWVLMEPFKTHRDFSMSSKSNQRQQPSGGIDEVNDVVTVHDFRHDIVLPIRILGEKRFASWWPGGSNSSEKYARQIGNLSQIGMNMKNIWNHHLGLMLARVGQNKTFKKTQGMCFWDGLKWRNKIGWKESVGKVMDGDDDEKIHTLPKTNIAPENGWLEDYFPFGARPISKHIFQGGILNHQFWVVPQ